MQKSLLSFNDLVVSKINVWDPVSNIFNWLVLACKS